MNLELTTNEFITLLKAVYLADWVANAQAESASDEDREIARLRRKLFAVGKEAGFEDLARHDPDRDDYFETDALAEDLDAEILERHVDRTFWRELIARLTDKIMDERFGAEITGWSDAVYKKRRRPIERKVEAELQENGLKNLFLLGDFS